MRANGTGTTRDASATSTAQYLDSGSSGVGAGGPQADSTASYSSSLIDTHLSVGIIYAAAVVDVPLTTGHSLDAVTDYVAMVTLATMPLGVASPAVPSTLSLFTAPPAVPAPALTDWDSAYLVALSGMASNRKANRQRGQLVTAMTKALQP